MAQAMTVRERILAVCHNQRPDRIPVAVYSRYLPRGYVERQVRDMGLGILEYEPVVSLLAPPWHNYPGYLSEVRGAEFDIRYYWQEGKIVERRSYTTPVGTIYQEVGQSVGAGSEHIRKYYIASLEDYKIVQYLVENVVFRSNEDSLQLRTEELGQDGIIFGRVDRCPYQKLLIELAGPERFLVDLYTNPEPVLELMDAMDRKMDVAFAMALESGVDVIWQPDNVTSDMTPPNAFERYCLPLYRRRARQTKQTGKPYLVHMDGRIKALVPLINQADFGGIESFSLPEIGGDLTLTEARSALPGKLVFPNFPANQCQNSKSKIERFLESLLAEAGTDVPFMLEISEDLPAGQWQRVLPIICRVMSR